MSMTTSLLNFCRNSKASSATRTQASGSSPLTWKIGAWIILATSVEYSDERDAEGGGEADLVVDDDVDGAAGAVAAQLGLLSVSATTPWPANAASPCMRIGSTVKASRRRGRGGPAWRGRCPPGPG
jgi:hypothetical protein